MQQYRLVLKINSFNADKCLMYRVSGLKLFSSTSSRNRSELNVKAFQSFGAVTFLCFFRRSTRSLRPGRTEHKSVCGGTCCTAGTAPPPHTGPPRRPPTPPSHSPGRAEPGGGDGNGEAACLRTEGRRMKQHGPGRAAEVPLRPPWSYARLS